MGSNKFHDNASVPSHAAQARSGLPGALPNHDSAGSKGFGCHRSSITSKFLAEAVRQSIQTLTMRPEPDT